MDWVPSLRSSWWMKLRSRTSKVSKHSPQLTGVVLDEARTGAEQSADSGLDVGERFLVSDPATGAVLVALVAA